MSKKPGRTSDGFDKSYLDIENALDKGQIHRDYITHCWRWNYAVRHLEGMKEARVLDFGCGSNIPLIQTVFASRRGDKCIQKYIGVDLNSISVPPYRKGTIANEKYGIELRGDTNILDVTKESVGSINLVTSFEVFEHCPYEAVEPILKHLHSLADDDAEFVYSTPVFNGKAAKNHINEMSRETFGWLLEQTGHTIVKNYGTFASIPDYKKHLTAEQLNLWEELREYHNIEVVANIFAPLYPQFSRNNVWVARKRVEGDEFLFPSRGVDQVS